MLLPILAVVIGLLVLVWSADKFVEGAASLAANLGMPTLLIGMVIMGFGTSAPEMVVSAIAASQGNPGIALGNAYGSNIANIGLILGLTALLSPIAVQSKVLRKELPLLALITVLATWQLWDGTLSRGDAIVLLGVFFLLMGWSILQGLRGKPDALADEIDGDSDIAKQTMGKSIFWLLVGIVLLVASSHYMVWGAVKIARYFEVADHIIGLTIIAFGTSLPELAASFAAVRKNEHDLAIGNVIGSNLFNTLAVVGIAGAIHPIANTGGIMQNDMIRSIIQRDMVVMSALTLSLFVLGYGWKKQGRINRIEGGILLSTYILYTIYLINTQLMK